jgi:hypothetical protein
MAIANSQHRPKINGKKIQHPDQGTAETTQDIDRSAGVETIGQRSPDKGKKDECYRTHCR